MVLPTTVVNYVIKIIERNRSKLSVEVSDPIEGSEDTDVNTDKASIIVYADFDESAELDANKRILYMPCSVYISCTSSSFETASESFNQAFQIALIVHRLIATNNRPELENLDKQLEPIHIQAQKIPITILRKSAEASVVQAAFTYNLSRI